MAVSDNRPFYLNLFKIRLPVTGFVSIFHRISGLLMFLALPYGVYLLELSLQGPEGFAAAQQQLQQPVIQLCLLVILWSVIHHFLAGVRFLLIDFDIGVEKQVATRMSWLLFAVEILLMIAFVVGVFL